MAKQSEHTSGVDTPKFAATTPPRFQGQRTDYDQFAFQTAMELQREVGSLANAVGTLVDQGKEHAKKLDRISNVIYAASAVVTVLGGILWFLLDKGINLLIQLKMPSH